MSACPHPCPCPRRPYPESSSSLRVSSPLDPTRQGHGLGPEGAVADTSFPQVLNEDAVAQLEEQMQFPKAGNEML